MKNKNIVRYVLRRVIPVRAYSFLSQLLNICEILRKYGLKTLKELYYPEYRNDNLCSVNISGFNYSIYFRPGTTDVDTIIQNIVREEYGYLPKNIEPGWIIDAGGYIGDVSVYFANRFKKSRIFTLEPDPGNFLVAEKNLKHYGPQITLIQKGLWSNPDVLELTGSLTGAKIVRTPNHEETRQIEVTDVSSLMHEYDMDCIDILKMDIEGAEKQVLESGSDVWLKKTKALIIEFHDSQTQKNCYELLHSHGFNAFEYRSLHYFLR